MKKFALAIALVLVLSASALASNTPTLSGSITMGASWDNTDGFYWDIPTREAVLGVSGDNYVFSYRVGRLNWFENAYLKTALPFPGTLSIGQLWNADDPWGEYADWQGAWYNGSFGDLTVNGYYSLVDDWYRNLRSDQHHGDGYWVYNGDYVVDGAYKLGSMTLTGSYESFVDESNEFKAGVSLPVAGLTVDAGIGYSGSVVDQDTYVKGTYALGDTLSVWGKYALDESWSVGGDVKLGAITLSGDYFSCECYDLKASATLGGIEYLAKVTDDFDSVDLQAKVRF